jgi:hypothetical protein
MLLIYYCTLLSPSLSLSLSPSISCVWYSHVTTGINPRFARARAMAARRK